MLWSPHKVQVDPEMAKRSASHKASQEGFVQIAHSSSLRFSLQIFSAHLASALLSQAAPLHTIRSPFYSLSARQVSYLVGQEQPEVKGKGRRVGG